MKRSMTPLHSGCVDKNREPRRIRPEAVRASEGAGPRCASTSTLGSASTDLPARAPAGPEAPRSPDVASATNRPASGGLLRKSRRRARARF